MVHLMEVPDGQIHEHHRYYAYLSGITGDDESVFFDSFSLDDLAVWDDTTWYTGQDVDMKRLRKVGKTRTPIIDIGPDMSPKIAFHPNVLIMLKILDGLPNVAMIEEWDAKSIIIADFTDKNIIEFSPYDNRFLNTAELKRICLEFRKSIIMRQLNEFNKGGVNVWKALFGSSSQD